MVNAYYLKRRNEYEYRENITRALCGSLAGELQAQNSLLAGPGGGVFLYGE